MALTDAIQAILAAQAGVTSRIIRDLIEEHTGEAIRLKEHYDRYRGEDAPILNRPNPEGVYEKINNKLVHDYPGLLVRTKAGYFMGVAPSIDYRPEKAEGAAEVEQKILQRWLRENEYEDKLQQTAIRAGNEGYAVWLVYLSAQGRARFVRVNPWECIFIRNRSTGELDYVLRYYPVTSTVLTDSGWTTEDVTRVEWWDRKQVTYYIQTRADGDYVLDDSTRLNPNPHPFGEVPFILVENNEEHLADWDAVASLIDGQDKVKSNLSNDIEQFASALLKALGFSLDADTLKSMHEMGALEIPEDCDLEWLRKEMAHAPHAFYLEHNDRDIHKLSGIPDLAGKDFSGNTPIISIRMKLFAMECLTIIAENKFRKALGRLLRMALRLINIQKSEDIDWLDIGWEFVRNIPINRKEEADTLSVLQGVVSEQTRLSLASFIDDPREEMKRMDEDKAKEDRVYPQGDIDRMLEDELTSEFE